MTAFPAAGVIGDANVLTGAVQAAFEAFLAATKQLPGAQAAQAVTIATGDITPDRAYVKVDTQAAAASDDLDHAIVTNLPAGSLLILRAANTARTVVVQHAAGGSGQFTMADAADFSLDDTEKVIVFVLESTTWIEVFRSYGNDDAKARTDLGLGTIATFAQGTTAGTVPRVDDIVGRQTAWVPVQAMFIPTTGGAAAPGTIDPGGGSQISASAFSDTTEQALFFQIALPKSWNAGVVRFEVYWHSTSSSTNGVVWGLSAVSVADNEVPGNLGTQVKVTDAHNGTNKMNVAAESGDVTIASTPANREIQIFRIARFTGDGGDTLAANANLVGLRLFFNTDKLNDN